MKVEEIQSFQVAGFCVRTKNSNEINPSTAKIGALWNRFNSDVGKILSETSKVYGVYTNYESDVMGEFDIIAGADTLVGKNIEDTTTITVKTGKYLVFSAKGEMPIVCINLWGEVWNYFDTDNCQHKRAYTTDFELYKGFSLTETELGIYIAIK